MCYNFCKLSLVDRPKERFGEAVDCLARSSRRLVGCGVDQKKVVLCGATEILQPQHNNGEMSQKGLSANPK